jgi:hypothetical protein
MTDIVKRLRDPTPRWGDTMDEAADEIERLRKEKDEWIGRYQAELDDNHRMIAWYKEACAERDRLREALRLADAALSGANMNMGAVEKKVRAALGESDA